jgi:hypothetical protein
MKQLEASSRDEWMDARVEAYVDDELSGEERMQFERILEADDYWKTQVQQARRIQGALKDLPQPSAPPELTQSILERTSRAHQPLPWWKDLLQQAMQTWRALIAARRRPVVDYAVGLAFVAVAVFFIVWPLSDPSGSGTPPAQVSSQLQLPVTAPYSESDVQRAETKAKWTFGYISRISRSSGTASPGPSGSTSDTSMQVDPVPNVIPDDGAGVRLLTPPGTSSPQGSSPR